MMTQRHPQRPAESARIESLESRTLLSGAIAQFGVITARQLAEAHVEVDLSRYVVPVAVPITEVPPIDNVPAEPEPVEPDPVEPTPTEPPPVEPPPTKTPAADPYAWTPLFNGKNLDGFYTYTESQGVGNDDDGYFKVEDGVIRATDRPAGSTVDFGYLATNESYANYHLRFAYKWGAKKFTPRASVARDAGVLFHVNGPDRLWPQGVEAQIQEGDTGDLWLLGARGDEPTANVTIKDAEAVTGQYVVGGATRTQQGGRVVKSAEPETLTGWNRVDVFATGQNATFAVNGVVVMRTTNLRRPDPDDPSELVALDAGKIAFQTEGAEVFYRDIEIRKLSPVVAPDGATTIFDGTNADNFKQRDGGGAVGWSVQNGALLVSPGSGDIQTKQSFAGDYKLHVEFKTNAKPAGVTEQDRGNSGIALAGSYEVQVLDSYGRTLAGENDLGAVYGVENAATNAALPASVWQAYDIEFTAAKWDGGTKVADARLTVFLNGVLIQDDVEVPSSTFTFDAETPGARPIIFQDHGNRVAYRNIWVVPA